MKQILLLSIAMVLFTGCSDQTAEYDIRYYLEHETQREEQLNKCTAQQWRHRVMGEEKYKGLSRKEELIQKRNCRNSAKATLVAELCLQGAEDCENLSEEKINNYIAGAAVIFEDFFNEKCNSCLDKPW